MKGVKRKKRCGGKEAKKGESQGQPAKLGSIYTDKKNAEVILQFQRLLRQLLGIIFTRVSVDTLGILNKSFN